MSVRRKLFVLTCWIITLSIVVITNRWLGVY